MSSWIKVLIVNGDDLHIFLIFTCFKIADYLLSNNHVNDVICHKFDFSDEEVMAYYISFLKTLSLRLNKHTIHFFYNEVPTFILRACFHKFCYSWSY